MHASHQLLHLPVFFFPCGFLEAYDFGFHFQSRGVMRVEAFGKGVPRDVVGG